jgi:hypothetical protein|nr:MAG TPA: hypothetical protein [Bacteriophage sp.]
MKLSEQARFELRVWLSVCAREYYALQYIYDEIKDWSIDDIELYKKISLGYNTYNSGMMLTKTEHDKTIKKMNFIKNGDKVRLKD